MILRRAFTLIELIVVMAIIAVLSLIIIAAIVSSRRAATETAHLSNYRTVIGAVETFRLQKGFYPPNGKLMELGFVGNPGMMNALGFGTTGLSPTYAPGCYVGSYIGYGVRVVERNSPSFSSVYAPKAQALGTDVTGKDVLIFLYNHDCSAETAVYALP